jgi:hypothetical protein
MKTTKYLGLTLSLMLLFSACEQEVKDLMDPCEADPSSCAPDTSCEDAEAGSANFTKFVAIGNSYVAGFQAGALFNNGQANSLPKILATQFECVGGSATFNQPDINSVNGFNIQSSVVPDLILGRLILFDPDGTGPRGAAPAAAGTPARSVTCPSSVSTPAVPAPYNTADLPTPFAGDKASLNNFGVPLIFLGQALIKETGGPSTGNPYYNPLYARFASNPGTSTLLGDALGAGGSFYLIWLGFDDVLLNAATGASGTYPMTDADAFNTQYTTAINTMLVANPNFKGVVGNIPDITTIPYFFTVRWNAITLDQATVTALAPMATGYNAFLDGMEANGIIDADERDARKINYVVGNNPILLTDETLTDLSSYMVGPYAGLAHLAKGRQATATDLVPLSAGAVLGTCVANNPQAVQGVSYPVGDAHILIPSETMAILTRTAQFNGTITAAVNGSNNRLALADVRQAYANLVAAQLVIDEESKVAISPSFAPPTGIFSEDGLHPNARGYAFTANVFIDAINAKFGSTIPHAKLSSYAITGLPVNPAP